jgi:hypothetical protein
MKQRLGYELTLCRNPPLGRSSLHSCGKIDGLGVMNEGHVRKSEEEKG